MMPPLGVSRSGYRLLTTSHRTTGYWLLTSLLSQNVIAVSIRTHLKLALADTREPLLCVKRQGARVLLVDTQQRPAGAATLRLIECGIHQPRTKPTAVEPAEDINPFNFQIIRMKIAHRQIGMC